MKLFNKDGTPNWILKVWWWLTLRMPCYGCAGTGTKAKRQDIYECDYCAGKKYMYKPIYWEIKYQLRRLSNHA